MSQQQKLEKVLDLLLAEDQEQAAELLHQIIVEKARTIYESVVEEEADDKNSDEMEEAKDDEVGGDPDEDFTSEIESDTDEVEADQENDGEPESDDDGFDTDSESSDSEESTEDRLEDLESQLADLRAEFDALMGEEMLEPQHAELAGDMADGELDGELDGAVTPADDMDADPGMPSFGKDEKVVGEVVAVMHEKKKDSKLAGKAPQAKKGELSKKNKMDEETKFLQKVADTGQKGTAKLVGTGKNTPLGPEQTQSPYTHAPSKKDYGGQPHKFGGGTGGEYGKYHGETPKKDTPTDNVDVKPKSSSIKADTTPKYTGGKSAGEGFTKSPFTKKPA